MAAGTGQIVQRSGVAPGQDPHSAADVTQAAATPAPHFSVHCDACQAADGSHATTGYLSGVYAASLAQFGTPLNLARSGGWLLARDVPGSSDRDAMGCYPLFACCDWSSLSTDFDGLGDELVSVAVVADPFGNADRSALERCFDFVHPFKEHFVVDLEKDPEEFLSRNHRYKALRSLRKARVVVCDEPVQHVDEWVAMYDVLIGRHSLRGIKAFSREAFTRQMQVPGLVMFRYLVEEVAIAAQLWFVQGDTVYNHLLAMHEPGYETWAAYGLCYEALCYFRSGAAGLLRHVDLGAGAGLAEEVADGLARFKRGWATERRQALFCGRIFDPPRYIELAQQHGAQTSKYFPAYRQGEFA